MLSRHLLATGITFIGLGLQSHLALAEQVQYDIIYNGKKVGTQLASMETLADGQNSYSEKTTAKFKQFFMTFNLSSEITVSFDDKGINAFSSSETFDGEKGSISGRRFGSKFEIVAQEEEEPPQTFVISADQFELSEITPPLLQYKLFSQKQVGDELSYLDFDSGSIQGIKLTALDKQADHLSVSFRYIGDKEFVKENEDEVSITINAQGKVLAFSEDDVQLKLIN